MTARSTVTPLGRETFSTPTSTMPSLRTGRRVESIRQACGLACSHARHSRPRISVPIWALKCLFDQLDYSSAAAPRQTSILNSTDCSAFAAVPQGASRVKAGRTIHCWLSRSRRVACIAPENQAFPNAIDDCTALFVSNRCVECTYRCRLRTPPNLARRMFCLSQRSSSLVARQRNPSSLSQTTCD